MGSALSALHQRLPLARSPLHHLLSCGGLRAWWALLLLDSICKATRTLALIAPLHACLVNTNLKGCDCLAASSSFGASHSPTARMQHSTAAVFYPENRVPDVVYRCYKKLHDHWV